MAITTPISSTSTNGLYDLNKTTLQAKNDKTDAQQQVKLAADNADTVKADTKAEEKRRVEQQAAATQTTNLNGQKLGASINLKA